MLGVRLDDPVRTLVAGAPLSVRATATLRGACQLMASELVGVLLVTEPNGTLGIVSERDVVAAVADGADVDGDRVRQFMSEDLATVDASESIEAAAELMLANEIRHLVVMDGEELVGVVSIRDVVGVVLEERAEGAPA